MNFSDPKWQTPPIPEAATQAALLYLAQCQLRAEAEEKARESEEKKNRRRKAKPDEAPS